MIAVIAELSLVNPRIWLTASTPRMASRSRAWLAYVSQSPAASASVARDSAQVSISSNEATRNQAEGPRSSA